MKSISLRTLLRQPVSVKRWTRAGQTVRVTDNGRPLWVIQPAEESEPDERRHQEIEEELAAILKEPSSAMPLSEIVLNSRR